MTERLEQAWIADNGKIYKTLREAEDADFEYALKDFVDNYGMMVEGVSLPDISYLAIRSHAGEMYEILTKYKHLIDFWD
jgi:hypothetical protein